MGFLANLWKLILIIPSVSAGFIGVIQAIIKLLKEICTLLLDIIVPVFPQTQKLILKMRDIINKIDDVFQVIKKWFMAIAGIKESEKIEKIS